MLDYASQYTAALKFAKSSLSPDAFHKGFDTRGQDDTNTASLYADYLHQNGHPTAAEVIRTHIQDNGYGHLATNIRPGKNAEALSDEHDLEPGQFKVEVHPFGKGHSVLLKQRSLTNPHTVYAWQNQVSPEEAGQLIGSFARDGIDADVDSKNRKTYGLEEQA